MRYLLIVLFSFHACTVTAGNVEPKSPSPAEAARGLLKRVLPDHVDHFVFEPISNENGSDVFEIESVGQRITVRGNNGVAMASGLNWYLKHYCHCHLSFCGDQLDLPDPLPTVEKKVRRVSPHKYRYFFNYCAFSYTMAWWDWDQWERMIDWMALHGINMPLSVTGQEAVWRNVGRRFGLSDAQIKEFFVGPGYLSFGWMGCIDGWCGPLPDSWIDSHLELQRKIIARQRELGMTPVLQGFTGHIPAGFQEKIPDAKYGRLRGWSGFSPGTHYVDPMDPLFSKIGKAFIEEQTRLYGTDHLYAADTFIEMRPPSNDPAFLAAMGKALFEGMRTADPDAIWVMQGWVFLSNKEFWQPPQAKALFGTVPDDRMILLDLFAEREPVWQLTEAFYGKPWIWCMLHNFGGRVGMCGGTNKIVENLGEAMTSPKRGKLSGIGVIMEGFGYNPAVYDLWASLTWRKEMPELDSWFPDFVHRRYGSGNEKAMAAWRLLQKTLYRQPIYTGTIICDRPGLPPKRNWMNPPARYDHKKVAQAWKLLLEASDELGSRDTYQYDVVHLARENLAGLSEDLAQRMVDSYQAKDQKAFAKASQAYLQLIRDMDELLATRREFLLGKWLADARRWGAMEEERRLYEWNARTIITLWGPPDSPLHEYAHRQWSGLMKGFYLPRWEKLVARLDESLKSGKPFDDKKFERDLRVWEHQWTHRNESYPATPQGDPVAASRRTWEKYGEQCFQLNRPEVESLTTNKPVSCSSSLAGHPAHLANDGRARDPRGHWATDVTTDKEPWWRVDLKKPKTVGRVVVVPYYGDGRYYGFTVETSTDAKTWQTVADRRDNRQPSTRQGYSCSFEPRSVRYIRVRLTHNSANTGRHLVEVMAYRE
ncbi:MAG: alpha-N-acetylglucosaminidase C-terminal domain-containing protein [Pirellulales bacterium]|nr:alpha-N-acetylglucosaminidase C-terminal domain-containing protein [Pirellulales bacterium]